MARAMLAMSRRPRDGEFIEASVRGGNHHAAAAVSPSS